MSSVLWIKRMLVLVSFSCACYVRCLHLSLEMFPRRRHHLRMFIICISAVRQSGRWFPLVLYIIACISRCVLCSLFAFDSKQSEESNLSPLYLYRTLIGTFRKKKRTLLGTRNISHLIDPSDVTFIFTAIQICPLIPSYLYGVPSLSETTTSFRQGWSSWDWYSACQPCRLQLWNSTTRSSNIIFSCGIPRLGSSKQGLAFPL
jgi:hypothetical protein